MPMLPPSGFPLAVLPAGVLSPALRAGIPPCSPPPSGPSPPSDPQAGPNSGRRRDEDPFIAGEGGEGRLEDRDKDGDTGDTGRIGCPPWDMAGGGRTGPSPCQRPGSPQGKAGRGDAACIGTMRPSGHCSSPA